MALQLTPITDAFSVAAQLSATDVQDVVDAGFKSIIINRPDYEGGPDQPTAADVTAAAQQAGLTVQYQPVVSGNITPQDIQQFAALLKEMPAPVLAYCRSGGRCSQLFQAATQS